jgi:ABC-2 type transport system ATP-binding protein
MALKEEAQTALVSNTYSGRDLKQTLLMSGWPQSLIDEYVLKTQRQFSRLEIRPESALVRLDSVSKKFKDKAILENVSLTIVPGELLGVIGLSGAGKTTLLNVLVGFAKPEQGRVTMKLPNGGVTSVEKDSNLVKAMFGFAAQTPSFYAKLTVKENLEHFGALYGIPETQLVERIKELLRFVGLESSSNTVAVNLSGGMQKRLDIACALIHEPKILILDEPTADLDPLLRKQMWQLIQNINRKGTTVIVASHFVDEIEENCSRIAVLANKRIQRMGTAEQLVGEYAKNYEIEIETRRKDYSKLTKSLSKLRVVRDFVEKGNTVVVYTSDPGRMLSWFAKYCQQKKERINKLSLARPSLSEVFESIVKNEV